MADLGKWEGFFISPVPLGSAQDLESRPLYIQQLDAQGLLCTACGFPLGTGVILVGTVERYRVRPCVTCAEHNYTHR